MRKREALTWRSRSRSVWSRRRGRGRCSRGWSRGSRGSGAGWLLGGMEPGVAGVGGGFTLAPGTGPAGWALFFLRYSAFIEERWRDGPVGGEIAGDNALYRRADLEACAPFDREGFWEVEIHRQLRQ